MKFSSSIEYLLKGAVICMFMALSRGVFAIDITELGVTPGEHDNTSAVQNALNSNNATIFFPAGKYKIGTISVPANKTLTFDPKAVITPVAAKVTDKNLILIKGDYVRLEGMRYDFTWNGATLNTTPVHNLIYAVNVSHLFVTGFDVKNSDPRVKVPLELRQRRGIWYNLNGTDPAINYSHSGYYNSQCLVYAVNCKNVTLENSVGSCLHGMMEAYSCYSVTVRGCNMISGNFMTHVAEGCECLRHHDNWSRNVKYQVSWFGGSPDPSNKPELPRGSSTVAIRSLKPGMDGYDKITSGVYDVLVQNNYAEYGNTLVWGNKGRQVVIDGNIARFISDYAYGTEGGENIIFSNNISINSTAGGIASMYWGEKLQITGNLIIVRHEPWDKDWSWWDHPSKYLGPFVRLHHGPKNPEDQYGSGSTLIANNLFINELTQRTTDLSIQEGRDVTVMGNKFINGRVSKVNAGKLTVIDNEFISRLEYQPTCIDVSKGADVVIVKGNVFRKEAIRVKTTQEESQSELNDVPYFLFNEDDGEDQPDPVDAPAIKLAASVKFFGSVQDNLIYGWKQAIKGELKHVEASMVVSNNTTEGAVDIENINPNKIKVDKNIILTEGLMP